MASNTEEVTLKELYLIIKRWFLFFVKEWKIIAGATLIGAIVGLVIAFTSSKRYFGELSFALEEKASGMGGGAYASIASQFGLDLGGGGGGAFVGDNLVELLKSRLMIEKALINPMVANGDTFLLVNKFIEFNGFREIWAKKPESELNNLQYVPNVPRENYSRMQDSVLNQIHLLIKKGMLSVKRLDKKLNLVTVTCISYDESFSKYFTEELVANTSKYYVEAKTKKSRYNIAVLEAKVDSVKHVLDSRLYGAAAAQDQNLNTVSAAVKVPFVKKQIDIQLLTTVYAELSKNVELSKYTLSRDEPLVHIIDTPILPLKYEKTGKMFSMLVFGSIFGLIAAIGLVIKLKLAEITRE